MKRGAEEGSSQAGRQRAAGRWVVQAGKESSKKEGGGGLVVTSARPPAEGKVEGFAAGQRRPLLLKGSCLLQGGPTRGEAEKRGAKGR